MKGQRVIAWPTVLLQGDRTGPFQIIEYQNVFFFFNPLQEKEFYVAVIGGSIIFAVLTLLCAKFTTIISSSIVGSGMIMASVDFFMHGSQTLLWVCVWVSPTRSQLNIDFFFFLFFILNFFLFSFPPRRPFTSNRIRIHRHAGVDSSYLYGR